METNLQPKPSIDSVFKPLKSVDYPQKIGEWNMHKQEATDEARCRIRQGFLIEEQGMTYLAEVMSDESDARSATRVASLLLTFESNADNVGE